MIREHLRIAWHALRSNTLRTLLTALSVSLGAGAIALMVSLSKSGVATITQGIDAVGGRHLVFVVPKESAVVKAKVYDKGLTSLDAQALRERVPGLSDVAFMTNLKRQTIIGNGKRAEVDVGVGSAFARFLNAPIAFGSSLPQETTARLCVLTATTARELFDEPENAVGQSIVLWGHRYRVTGVTAMQDDMGFDMGGVDKLRTVVVPSAVMIKDEGVPDSGFIILTDDGSATHDQILRVTNAVLLSRHLGMEDFELLDFERIMTKFDRIFLGLRVLTGLIAAVSLLIAGAGVMNVLLASIKQRVGEIGMRRAIGASQADIRAQFLTESIVLAGLGGVIGGLLGLAGAVGVGLVAQRFVPAWQVRVSIEAAVIAVVVAAITGLVFGLQPARRAARLEVVACLRGDA